MQNKNNYAIIMAGGVGSRFWPGSRTHFPKQFLDILGTGKSLLQQTYNRFLKRFLPENIYIVTNEAYIQLVKDQLPGIGEQQILGEPIAKNTAACIAYACGKINKINTHAVCIVAPSDHLILDEPNFLDKVEMAINFARTNPSLVTLGIRPSRPDTGYGYIQFHNEVPEGDIFKVKTFTEKPSLDLAQTFVESGDFLWNAGIFVWSISSIKAAFKEHLPEQFTLFKDAHDAYFTPDEYQTIKDIYEQTRSISIDYGIMEKANNVYVMPSEFGWSDLGTWTSLYEISNKDENENVSTGKNILFYNSSGCMVHTAQQKGNKLFVLNSVKDLIVVDTPDVLMICDKNKEQEVKEVATDIKIKFNEKYS
ncbi:MAG: mannose-1-phosphate guanylyltransferase [Bacteroidia bacterium]|nr:mannose-1-phosphate guanylyltransferase [Bacteroidia bacterium]MCF8427336.1 mannose-1-phosphate guanylyltransferase [Bacteroidia bacterium]